MSIQIRSGSAAEAAAFLGSLPEFTAGYPLQEYQRRLQEQPHLVLLATAAGAIVGCKVGYALNSSCFYSWMGGVAPAWRRKGIAELLAEQQESWVRNQGYYFVRFKTRNSCRGMLHFALNRGFNIIEVETKEQASEHRIWLEKSLR